MRTTMNTAIKIFQKLKSLEPLDSFISDIPLGGLNYIDRASNDAKILHCNNLYVIGYKTPSDQNTENASNIDLIIHYIESLTEINFSTAGNLLLFIGDSYYSQENLKKISDSLKVLPQTVQLFGAMADSENELKNDPEVSENSEFKASKENFGEISLLYFPKKYISKYFSEIASFIDNKADTDLSVLLQEDVNFIKLESKTVIPLSFPWKFLDANELAMKTLTKNLQGNIEAGTKIHGNVVVELGAKVLQGSYIIGPAYISKDAMVGPNCFIRGSSYIGRGVRIGQSVEIKNSIILDNTHVGHLSYIGDSILGPDNNFGAGSKTANLAFHDKSIKMIVLGKRVNTFRRKLGIITGENVKTGINASLMPGIKLYSRSVVGAHVLVQKDLKEQTVLAFDANNDIIEKRHNFF